MGEYSVWKASLLPKLARVALKKLGEVSDPLLVVMCPTVAQLSLILAAQEPRGSCARGCTLSIAKL